MRIFLCILWLMSVSLSASAELAQLEITVTDITKSNGTVLAAIVNDPGNWLKSDKDQPPFRDASYPVTGTGSATIIFEDLPPGTYAVSIFQDLNGNAKLDTNFIGYPKEPFGFSAPMGKFGPPKFDAASITVTSGKTSIEIELN